MLEKEGLYIKTESIAAAVIYYNRLDAIDWII